MGLYGRERTGLAPTSVAATVRKLDCVPVGWAFLAACATGDQLSLAAMGWPKRMTAFPEMDQ